MALSFDDYDLHLRPELINDPSAIGYDGKSNADIAALLVGQTQTEFIDVPSLQVQGLWYELGCWDTVFARSLGVPSGTPGSDPVIAAKGFIMLVQASGLFGTSISAIRTKIDADLVILQNAGDLSSAQVTATESLWSQATSRAQQIGLSQLLGYDGVSQIFHVAIALAGPIGSLNGGY